MNAETPTFAIRPVAFAGTTLYELRDAVLRAPPDAQLVLFTQQGAPPRFPPICPNCHQLAQSALRIQRAFVIRVLSGDDTPNESVPHIDTFDVPFCDACIQRHRAEPNMPSPWTPLLRLLSDANGFAGLVVLALSSLFLYSAVERLSLFPLGLACIPLAIAYWLLRSTWVKSHYMSVPTPTTVDMAVDFTPSLNLDFEPAWCAFQFRSPHYAELFRRANILALWDPHSGEAQSAAAQRQKHSSRSNWVIGVGLAAILLWTVWTEYLSPYVMPYFHR